MAKAVRTSSDVVDWDQAIAPYMVVTGQWGLDLTDPARPKPVKKSGPPKNEDWKGWVKMWCDSVAIASSPLTVVAQGRPEHQWETHPEVDGCQPDPASPPLR